MTNAQDIIQRPNSYNYTKGIDLAHEGKTSEALESFEKELKDNPKNGYPDFVIAYPKNLHQRVWRFSDVLPSALFGCKPPCSEVV